MTDLITAREARLMAACCFSAASRNGQTARTLSAIKTNRRGAFFFHGTRSSGLIIDARCLSSAEYDRLRHYARPETACEYRDPNTGKIKHFTNPYRRTSGRIPYLPELTAQSFKVFDLERAQWCLAAIFCGIRAVKNSGSDPVDVFAEHFSPSNHQLFEARGLQAENSLAIAA